MKLFITFLVAVSVYWLQAYLYKRYWDKKLYLQLSFSRQEVCAGEELELIEEIKNEKRMPLSILLMKFSCPKCFHFFDEEHVTVTDSCYRNDTFFVNGYQRITKKLPFVVTQRGYYKIRHINLLTRDYFLTKQHAKLIESGHALSVMPKPYCDVELDRLYNHLLGEMINQSSLIENPYTFSGIRDYTNRDSIRSINWKATAHNSQLMVNVYEHTSAQQIKVLLNLEALTDSSSDELNECAISIVSACVHRFIGEQIPVAFASNGQDVVTGECDAIAAGGDYAHVLTIDRCLSRIGKAAGLEVFIDMLEKEIAIGNSNVTYIIVSPCHKEKLLKVVDELVERGMLVQMLVPCYSLGDETAVRSYIHTVKCGAEEPPAHAMR